MTVLRRIFQAFGWAVAGLLIGAFLIGYAAPYLPPARFWWTDLFAVLLPPLGVAVGLLCLGLLGQGLYRRAWGRVAIGAALLLLVAIRFEPRFAVGGASATEAGTLRVMTFNVPMVFARQKSGARALGRFVQQEAPDVLALQESWMATGASPWTNREDQFWPPRTVLEDSLGYAPPRALPPQTTVCQPLLGRLPLDSMSVHPLPPEGQTDRCAQYTRTQFTWENRSAVLYNVHLHTIGAVRPWDGEEGWRSLDRWQTFLRTYREGALRRAQQARLIRRRIEQERHPVLVVGDFNSTPHQWAYRHIARGLQRVGDRGMWGQEATFPAHRPLVRIDHILAGPAWEVVDARVPALDGDTTISDHRPVEGRLRWRRD